MAAPARYRATIVFTDDDLNELLASSKRGSIASARQP